MTAISPTDIYVSRPSGPEARALLVERLAATKLAGHTSSAPASAALTLTCELCSVSFAAGKKAHHSNSKRHRMNVANDGAKVAKCHKAKSATEQTSVEQSWESEAHGLFCLQSSSDINSNIAHMRAAHSFPIPDISYLSAPVELLIYLAAIIDRGDCLFCHSPEARVAKKFCYTDEDGGLTDEDDDSRFAPAFRSARAARAHMLAKGHCKVSWANGAEIAVDGIYDWGDVDTTTADGTDGVDGSLNPQIIGGVLVLPSGARLSSRAAPTLASYG
ncbi:hypothetical protein HDU86_004264 [Geranomyces michiganensis]|nr:hypothetical protein HDU86_004264 [Geranomyces michiganensis]